MKTKKLLAALLTLLIFLSPTFAAAETVVTSFYPIYLFALNLTHGIDGITIRNLAAPNTGCLHDYLCPDFYVSCLFPGFGRKKAAGEIQNLES